MIKALKSKQTDHKKPKLKTSRVEKIPFYIFMSSIGFLLVSFVLIYLVDLRNVFGARDVLYSLEEGPFRLHQGPFMFYYIFGEGNLAEIFQWLFLAGSALISMFISGIMHKRNITVFFFWTIMAIAFVLMLIEDAGNPRHTIRDYVIIINDNLSILKAIEGVYFLILASIPIYALLNYRKPIMEDIRTARYLIFGFAGYGIAAFFSFAGDGFAILDKNLYAWIGGGLRSFMLFISDNQTAVQWSLYEEKSGIPFFSFFLMEWMVEESIELMSAAAFCASAVAFLLYVRRIYGL